MRFFLIIQFVCFVFLGISQELFPGDGRAYTDGIVPRIDISIDPQDLDLILDPNNVWSDDLYPAVFKWSDIEGDSILSSVGLRLRGNTSRLSAKKSFKVKFKAFGGDEFYGLSDMNLNGEHNDPSVSRANLAWDFMKQAGIPSARANHVELYINEEYFGLYANVEHIDKDYLNVRYQNPNGNLYKMNYGCNFIDLGSNPDNYKIGGSNRVFELKTNKERDDYSQLAHFMQVLNNLSNPDFRCDLEEVFDIDLYLRALAMEVLLGHFDSPAFNQNNGYLYEDPKSGQIKYIPFDLDNTFGIIWGNTNMATKNIYKWHWSNDPLRIYEIMMSVPEYRYLYGFYIDYFIQEFFNLTKSGQLIDELRERLNPFVLTDDYYTYSYGYSANDFWTSFNFGTGDHVPFGIKEFMSSRAANAKDQLQNINIVPILSGGTIRLKNNYYFEVSSKAYSNQIVKVYFNINNTGWENLELKDDGLGNDLFANDQKYAVNFSPQIGDHIEYYFSSFNSANNKSSLPKCGLQNFTFIVPDNDDLSITINEIMATNDSYPDEYGEYDDWLEIYNAGETTSYINLFLSDEIDVLDKWALPITQIPKGGFKLIWADNDKLQGEFHANFKLKKSGESLYLSYYNGIDFKVLDQVSFTNASISHSFGKYPNGVGPMIELSPTPGTTNIISGIDDILNVKIKLIPNPVEDLLTIKSNLRNQTFEVFSIDGTKIVTQQLDNMGLGYLNMSGVTPGLYFVRIAYKGSIINQKFIKL